MRGCRHLFEGWVDACGGFRRLISYVEYKKKKPVVLLSTVSPLGCWLMWKAHVGGMAALYVTLHMRKLASDVLLYQ